eukprot:252586-Rhodomonas_salina.1
MEVDIISIGSILVPILVTSGCSTYYLGGKIGALEEGEKALAKKIEALEKKINVWLDTKIDNVQKALDTKIDNVQKALDMK